ncbi:MAG: phospholipase D family protein [Burkholderiaceae bacterium]|nr:phospholipase D family protein [Burkholderiaceae bacterium]
MKRILICTVLALIACSASAKKKGNDFVDNAIEYSYSLADKAPNGPLVETGFSPDSGSERLVIKVINASESSIRLAAYSFTSPAVVRALLHAKKRGVDVRVVVDDKGNRSKSSVAALNLLVNAGIPTKTISAFAIHHDKFIVSDGKHVQTGSFNYSQAAAHKNSENVIVLWNNRDIASTYLRHWQSRFDRGLDFRSTY